MDDSLELFLPPVRAWFRASLGAPTPAQSQGWPAIAAGKNTLILAPTGSGKTLAAFLACLDGLWRQDPLPPGVRVLYVSPLKALNNDIHRNLQVPLEGVAEMARRQGFALPCITSAVRTGDTPTAERQRQARKPPHVLITTLESLHLLLTSRARESLRGMTHCIVDEIHALCANKRGVFLALLLERLEALSTGSFTRIGLSATQRPLEEVARFLGGATVAGDGSLIPRPVTVVDAGIRRDLDLRVVSPVDAFGPMPEKTVWPSIYRLLGDQIRQHRSTLVFANNRRAVERITAHLNEAEEQRRGAERPTEAHSGETAPIPETLARAHHGSVSLEMRQQTEQALKEGRLPAVVSTASLEMGIDMGAVDLVCQVESPGNVARALQRVGRAGHIVGQKSKGRLIPKMSGDLLEQAVLAREMTLGRVEEIRCPRNCLDVLAQQVVAAVAVEPWDVSALFALARRAYPYRDLTAQAFETVLEMMTGRYRFQSAEGDAIGTLNALHPRISWDRVHHRLLALPGSQQLALLSGGTIPDTGQYAAYTPQGVRVGELDEEFIYERRVGDVFLLGTNAWRIERIETDRVQLSPAEGMPALVPFWRGESTGRSPDLGLAIGAFLRELGQRLESQDCLAWLMRDYHLDPPAARDLHRYVQRQQLVSGALPTDRTLLLEASRDQLGDWQVILLSPFGHKMHLALRLALEARLRQRLGYSPRCLHHNDGLLVRLTDTEEPILNLFEGLTPENLESLILEELAESALFALRFRQNAARALLLPRGKPGTRAPLWLQRLRGRDLLQVARRHADFPIVVETFRECLHDHLDLPRLAILLDEIACGRIEIKTRRAEVPSPFASSMLFAFTASSMYEYDQTDPEPDRTRPLDTQLLDQLVAPERHGHLLDPRAVQQVERRLRGLGHPPRTTTEMAEWLRRLGDLARPDLEGPMAGFLEELQREDRVRQVVLTGVRDPERWVLTEEEILYQQAFGLIPVEPAVQESAAQEILERFLRTHALVGLRDIVRRYPLEEAWARRQLETWSASGRLIVVSGVEPGEPLQWSAPPNLDQMQRGTLAIQRREVVTCAPPQLVDFMLRWQGAHPDTRRGLSEGVEAALERLEGLALSAALWEQTVLPARVPDYQPRWLDEAVGRGTWTWSGRGENVVFHQREALLDLSAPVDDEAPALDATASSVLEALRTRGALFVTDLASSLRLPPGQVRAALGQLARRGLATNDFYDVARQGEEPVATPAPSATTALSPLRSRMVNTRSGHSRRGTMPRPEGRWSLVPWGQPSPEEAALARTWLLLRRHGLVARELALMDPAMPPWRVLYEILSRLELAGEVRRGYFAEGLSGAQFALPEAADTLQQQHLPSTAAAPVLLVHSLDPANLYGSGAPFDIALLDGGTRPLHRRAGNWLTLRAGRPLLLIEGQGKRLTALPSASRDDLMAAVACLPRLLDAERGRAPRHVLTVEEWNGQPVTASEGRPLLEATGFVRDYRGMTLYAAWR